MDLIHLARQTGGSRQLEAEVLALMARHVERVLHDGGAGAGGATPDHLHAIVGAARNVGAFPLARAAAAIERDAAVDQTGLAAFRHEARRLLDFIARLEAHDAALTTRQAPTTCAA